MEKTYFAIALLFVGLCLGSFVNAAVWRIKNKKKLVNDRSECPHCHHKLQWVDLLPVVSWLMLRAKCRYCNKPISEQYPLVELGVGAFFVASLAFWPHGFDTAVQLSQFGIWLAAGVLLAILLVYDLKWLLLPDRIVYPLIILGIVYALLEALEVKQVVPFLIDIIGAVLILSGFYLLLFIGSNGRWIGFGDVKLGLALGLLLSNWQLALLTLFLANVLGCLVFVPALALKKINRESHIPFGPFLIAAFVIAGLFGHSIIDFYLSVTYTDLMVPRYN